MEPKKQHKQKKTFTMHNLMLKSKIPHKDRNILGKQMADAYRIVFGKGPEKFIKNPKLKKNGQPSFQVSVYPIEMIPIAQNIINQYFEKKNGTV